MAARRLVAVVDAWPQASPSVHVRRVPHPFEMARGPRSGSAALGCHCSLQPPGRCSGRWSLIVGMSESATEAEDGGAVAVAVEVPTVRDRLRAAHISDTRIQLYHEAKRSPWFEGAAAAGAAVGSG